MKWRLLAAFIGLTCMVLIVQDIPLLSYLRRVETERLVSGLERDAFILAGTGENLLSGEGPPSPVSDLQATVDLYSARHGARVVITDRDGLLVVSSDPTDVVGDDFSNRPEIAQAMAGSPATGERDSQDVGESLLFVAVPVLSGANVVGTVRLTYSASEIDDRVANTVRGLLLVLAISVVAASIAALFLANGITAPLRRLRRSTELLAAGDFSQRADTRDGPPEIRSLATSFNTMTEQIAGLVEQQRSFAGDASHQLRTPLTALRLQLERAASVVDVDPEAARNSLEAAGAETERLQRLVEGLLLIARSDGAAPTSRVDVSAIVRERADVWAPFAEERGVGVTVTAGDGLFATAIDGALEQIIDNFVDNALALSTPGQTLHVTASATASAVEVHVIDEGPGMPVDQLRQAFDRFWRAPDAPQGGSGIGLAVVQHLASSSGGNAHARNRLDRTGLDVWVELPRYAAPISRALQ